MAGTANFHTKLMNLGLLLRRHWGALRYALTVIVPIIVRDRRRPVIFTRFTGMGDIVSTVPAALELMQRHPGKTFIYNCHPDFVAIPRLAGVAKRTTSFISIGVVGYWYRWLLAAFYDFAHRNETPDQVAAEPMVTEFCRQFGLPPTDRHPQLQVDSNALERVKGLLRGRDIDPENLILIHPGPSWPVKEWPREQWIELVARLRAEGHASIAQIGVGRYMNFGQVAVEAIPGAVSLVDAFSVEESVAAISLAKLFIGIDSGLLHIAASTQTPSVGLFGPTSPQFFYAPGFRKHFVVTEVECAGCHHRLPRLHWVTGCPYEIRCMKTMSAEAVARSCVARLSEAPAPEDSPHRHQDSTSV